jgi:hypothetical protein
MSPRKFLCTLTILLNFLNHGYSMETDEIGERFFKCTLSKHDQVNLNARQLLDYILKYSYLGDYQCINAGMEGFFYTLAARGWLTVTRGTPPEKPDIHFDVITNYAITNEAEVKKYLQEHYTSMKEYQKHEQSYPSEGGLSGAVSEDDGEE